MATTMNLIARQTVGSGGAASVTFSNIPQTFTDLKIVISARGTTAATEQSIKILPNGSSSNATFIQLQGYGTGTYSGTGSYWYAGEMSAASGTSNTFGSTDIYIPNYTSSNYKSANNDTAQENNSSGSARLNLNATLWSSTSAITSIVIQPAADNFAQYSTFYLYGISSSSTQNTSVPLASGGDVITTDGSYWYHAFLYSGSFTPLKALTTDVLVVAGGGGGGSSKGTSNSQNPSSGGAGGGFLSGSMALTATNYSITVGAGGAGGVGNAVTGTSGSNSVFNGATALGGGGGVPGNEVTGVSGGSGSGGSGTQVGGSATQGNSGGLTGYGFGGGTGGGTPAGGSGGAGGAGANGSGGSSNGTNGGLAKSYVSYNGTQYYAGGGGGGAYWIGSQTGGTGGTNAGNGASGQSGAQSGTNAVANFGGGGGGAGAISGAVATGSGGNGGSGIIIVRYAV